MKYYTKEWYDLMQKQHYTSGMTVVPDKEYTEDEIPFCTLRPIALPGEREMPEEVYEEGAEVYLSRQHTVPNDRSIDDEEQACFFFSDGHWFIEDRSRDNSTYVHAGAGIKLEPGDIIKMGDRQFVFSIKTRKK